MDQTIFDPIDAYCERLGPGLWAEPLNALTNLAFLVAALVCARRFGRPAPPLGLALVGVLGAIGVGSGLFHTAANGLTALLDVLAIAVFVFLYVYAVNLHVLGWSRIWAWASMLALAPYLALATTAFAAVPGFAVSAPYWSVCALIAGYGVVLWSRRPGFARGLLTGAAILALSITTRSLDLALCRTLPFGTHFLWHVLNAIMLGWMIETYRRAVPAAPTTPLAATPPRG
jgi:hypothetical protein